MTPVVLIGIFVLVVYDTHKCLKKEKESLKVGKLSRSFGIIFGLKGKNIVAYSPCNDEGHIAVFGGSGLGKTSALLIPTLRKWQGTSFTIDISGDICGHVRMLNKLVYAPSDEYSSPYNIFHQIDIIRDKNDVNEALERLAFLLMPEGRKMSDTSKFFNDEGRKILTASLIAFYHEGMDFIPICERVVEKGWVELFNDIDRCKNCDAIRYINSFMGTSEQNTAGCKQAVDLALKLFATNEKVKKSVRRPKDKCEEYFSPIKLEEFNVFVKIEDAKLELYAPLLHIITAQCLEYFSERPESNKTPILLCLDEFVSLGKLEIYPALRKLRKKKVRIMMLTQSIPDIDLVYGKDERMAMMNNYKFKVLLGAEDPETQEYFAKMIGYKDAIKHSVSKNANSQTFTESEDKEWIIEPARLARLDAEDNSLIMICDGKQTRLKKNYYFLNEREKNMYFENVKHRKDFNTLMEKYNKSNDIERKVLLYIQSASIMKYRKLFVIENGSFIFNMKILKNIGACSSAEQHLIALAWQLWRGTPDKPSFEECKYDEEEYNWMYRFSVTNTFRGLDKENTNIAMQAIKLYYLGE